MVNLGPRRPSPSDLLGSPGYGDWYEGQYAAFTNIADWYNSPVHFLGVAAPTGTGKTLLSLLAARISGARTCILTSTKGLQDQYYRDAEPLGGVLVKGQNNFHCTLAPSLTADAGPCHEGMSCPYARSGDCPYRAQLKAGLDAQIVITNYAYYLAQTRFSTGLGEFGLLCLDEAHESFRALEGHLTVFLSKMDIESLGLSFPGLPTSEIFEYGSRKKEHGPGPDGITPRDLWAQWRSWAACSLPLVRERVDALDADVKKLRESEKPVPTALSHAYRTARSTAAKLASLASETDSGEWIIQRTYHGFVFTPRWVRNSGSALFGAVPKVMLMSAILSAKTADSVGVPDGADRAWLDVDSYFPPQNAPIYHIPTTRVNYLSDDYSATIWVSRIDQIISRRLDRKGIVFTVSYERARLLLSRSRFREIMVTHSTGDVTLVVNRFKAMKPPAVLVSPSVTTGYDFPGKTCLVPGTLVRTLKGYKPIEEISVGDTVLGHTGFFCKVIAVDHHHYSGPVVTICSRGSYPHTMTPDHLVYTSRGWVRADALSTKTRALYPITKSVWGGAKPLGRKWISGHRSGSSRVRCSWDNTLEFWRLVGIWAAEGNINLSRSHRKTGGQPIRIYAVEFNFNIKELDTLGRETCDLIDYVLGNKRPRPFPTHNNGCKVSIKNGPFAVWLRHNVGYGSRNKRVPSRLFYCEDIDAKRAFLSGVLDGDGSKTIGGHWDVGLVSGQLALGVRDLMLATGLNAYVTQMTNGVWRVRDGYRDDSRDDLSRSKILRNGRQQSLPITSITHTEYSGEVFDLSVLGAESYSLVGLCVHNCGQGKPQYLVVGKVPYPDTKDLVLQARHEDDKEWASYLAMQTFVQEVGRVNRGVDDLSETFVVDDSVTWFLKAYGKFAPKYFLKRWRGSLSCVPDPLF